MTTVQKGIESGTGSEQTIPFKKLKKKQNLYLEFSIRSSDGGNSVTITASVKQAGAALHIQIFYSRQQFIQR